MRFLPAPMTMMVILASCFAANAQDAPKVCNTECLMQKIDALKQEVSALQQKVDGLTTQINKSIKLGQDVTLHTQNGHPGGCLTYFGPSGDQGGPISWNANCSRDSLWTIN